MGWRWRSFKSNATSIADSRGIAAKLFLARVGHFLVRPTSEFSHGLNTDETRMGSREEREGGEGGKRQLQFSGASLIATGIWRF
jgi:hypothetical protein